MRDGDNEMEQRILAEDVALMNPANWLILVFFF